MYPTSSPAHLVFFLISRRRSTTPDICIFTATSVFIEWHVLLQKHLSIFFTAIEVAGVLNFCQHVESYKEKKKWNQVFYSLFLLNSFSWELCLYFRSQNVWLSTTWEMTYTKPQKFSSYKKFRFKATLSTRVLLHLFFTKQSLRHIKV